MSEKHPLTPESKSSAENIRSSQPEALGPNESRSELLESQAETENKARKELEGLHDAKEQDEILEFLSDEDNGEQKVMITKDDKQRAYVHTLKQVQSRLSKPSKRFSRIIHNPAVERTSELMEKTIARPSGILGAAMFATIGLSIMTFFARRYGFALSGAELALFISAGWAAGMVIEFFWRKFIKKS